MKKPTPGKGRKDTALQIVKALAETPNGAPIWTPQYPVFDPLGNVMAYVDGTQCLICYKGVKGSKAKHEADCAYIRARRYLKGKPNAQR